MAGSATGGESLRMRFGSLFSGCGWTAGSKRPACPAHGRSRLIAPASPSCVGTGRTCRNTKTSQRFRRGTLTQLTLLPEEAPVRTSRWLEAVQDWMASGPGSSTSSSASLIRSLPHGFSGRTSLAPCPPMEAGTSGLSSGSSPVSGPRSLRTVGEPAASVPAPSAGLFGACWTLNTSEWPSAAAVPDDRERRDMAGRTMDRRTTSDPF